jgi:hypothetical protein
MAVDWGTIASLGTAVGTLVLVEDGPVYLAISVRNAGNGIAVMRSRWVWPQQLTAQERPDLEGFRRQTRDLYVAPARHRDLDRIGLAPLEPGPARSPVTRAYPGGG